MYKKIPVDEYTDLIMLQSECVGLERKIEDLNDDVEILLNVILNKRKLTNKEVTYFAEKYNNCINKIINKNKLKEALDEMM